VVLVIAHVPKATELRLTALVLTLTNVTKTLTLVATVPHVLTLRADTHANVSLVHKEIHIMVSVHQHKDVAPPIVNVVRMKNVFNLENAFVHLHSSLMLETYVEIHVNVLLVELMPNVVQLIHLNVCAKLVSKEIHFLVVSALMNAPLLHVPMVLNVSTKKVVTNVFVLKECLEIHTRAVVSLKILKQADQHAKVTATVLRIFIVKQEHVLVLVLIYSVDQTHFVNLKIMLDGADVVLDINQVPMEIVFLVSLKMIIIVK